MKRYLGETPMLDYSDENIQQLMEHRKWREKDEFECVIDFNRNNTYIQSEEEAYHAKGDDCCNFHVKKM